MTGDPTRPDEPHLPGPNGDPPTAPDPMPDSAPTSANGDPPTGPSPTADGESACAGGGTELPVASGRETWRAVARLARPQRRLVVVGAVVLLAATTAALAIPLLLGAVVDVVVGNRPEGQLEWLVAGLVAATIMQGVLYGFGDWAVGRLGELVLADLREDVVDRALAVPIEDIERAGTGDLVARACGDVDAVGEAMREAIPEILACALIIALTVVGLAALDWRLALGGLAAVPIQVVAARWYLRRSGPIYTAERAAEGVRSQRLHASVTGARAIRSFRLQQAHVATIEQTSRRAVDLALSAASVRARFYSALNGAELVGLGAVLLVGYPLVQSETITVGGATAAALFFYRLFDPIGALLLQLDTAQAAGAALARLVGVASLPAPAPATPGDQSPIGAGANPGGPTAGGSAHPAPASPGADGPSPIGASASEATSAAGDLAPPGGDGDTVPGDGGLGAAAAGGVRLSGVTFSYDGERDVLTDVDLTIDPGERVALVGPSGAGKTTVAKLVAGIHRTADGTIDIGAGRITLVTQEVHVFAGPLAADLRLARPSATDDDLHRALDLVGATPWVDALPDGLATVVGDGGHSLSPTEAQQLALARLLLADPAVAVLDEATAEAGSSGAGVLDDAAAAAIEGRTALVIAHRLSQAAAADRIVVLDQGRVAEQGTHDELLAAGGVYAGLWAAWSGSRSLGPAPAAL